MKHVLVTGANGLVGRELTTQLRKAGGYNIFPTDIVPDKEWTLGNKLDITDKDEVEIHVGVIDEDGVVIHLAALVAGPASMKKPYNYIHTNVDGTLNILEAMRKSDVKKLVTMSSWSTFGTDIELPITEKTKQKPENPYGVSKTMIDQMYKLYAELYDLEIIVLRPTMLYGAGQAEYNLVQEIADHMVTGEPFEIWGEGLHTRELMHVTDMANIIRTAIHHKPKSNYEIYITGTEKPLSVVDVCEAGQKIAPFEVKYVPSNKWVFDQKSDMTKIKTEMGIDPTKFIGIDEGLRESYVHKKTQS